MENNIKAQFIQKMEQNNISINKVNPSNNIMITNENKGEKNLTTKTQIPNEENFVII